MEPRKFILSFPNNSQETIGKIDKFYTESGYLRVDPQKPGEILYTKGKKWATYLGLVNWDLIFRTVKVELLPNENKVRLTYLFSWLTNIGVLLRSSGPELTSLKSCLDNPKLSIERYR